MNKQVHYKNEKSLIEELRILSIQNKHLRGLTILRRYLRTHKNLSITLQLKEPFMLYHIGKTTEAIKIYKKILQGNKDFLNALIFLGRTYARAKKEKAVLFAKVAYDISPNLVTANNLANMLDALGLWKEAEETYRKTMKYVQRPEDRFVIQSNLALCYDRQKKNEKAIRLAQKLLKSNYATMEQFAFPTNIVKKILNKNK